MRPAEVFNICGDASKAKMLLGWEPETRFRSLTKIMMEADIELLEAGDGLPQSQ